MLQNLSDILRRGVLILKDSVFIFILSLICEIV